MRIKDFLQYFFIFCVFILASAFVATENRAFFKPKNNKRKAGIKTIVIDAGHGGKDPGCVGNPKSESKITLGLALKLGAYIEQNLPDVRVIYTRKTDVFVELYERANIANRNNADLFISIHCNSLPAAAGKSAHGTEVYVMGLHTADENLEIAKKVAERENQTILMEADYKKNYGGFDPKDPATHILLSMAQNVHLDQSIRVAGLIHSECKAAGHHSRGVHQAGFVVIRATAMPSILVESGYLTNVNDNAFLQSQKGQNSLAKAMYRAVKSFKYELEGKKKEDDPAESEPNSGGAESSNEAPNEAESNQKQQHQNTDEATPPNRANETKQRTENQTTPLRTKRGAQPQKNQIAEAQNEAQNEATKATKYYVQLLSNNIALPESSPVFRGETNLFLEIANNRYRYMAGPYTDSAAASKAVRAFKAKGFAGAFVTKR